jgi:hypothetical protein
MDGAGSTLAAHAGSVWVTGYSLVSQTAALQP